VILVVIVALLLAYFIVHAAYIQGKRKAEALGSGSSGRGSTYF